MFLDAMPLVCAILCHSTWELCKLTNLLDRGAWQSCERGRDQKHDGRYEQRKGQEAIQNGNLIGGLLLEFDGRRNEQLGRDQQCRTGGRCNNGRPWKA